MLDLLFNGIRLSELLLIIVLILIIGGAGTILIIVLIYVLVKKKRQQEIEDFIRTLLNQKEVSILDCEFLADILEECNSDLTIEDIINESSVEGNFIHGKMYFVKDSFSKMISGHLITDLLKRYDNKLEKLEKSKKIHIPLKEAISEDELSELLEI